jgi:DNA-binding SARP family transcriptional activator
VVMRNVSKRQGLVLELGAALVLLLELLDDSHSPSDEWVEMQRMKLQQRAQVLMQNLADERQPPGRGHCLYPRLPALAAPHLLN